LLIVFIVMFQFIRRLNENQFYCKESQN